MNVKTQTPLEPAASAVSKERQRLRAHIELLLVTAGLLALVFVSFLWSGYWQALGGAEVTTRNLAQLIEARFQGDLDRAAGTLASVAKDIRPEQFSRRHARRDQAIWSRHLSNLLSNFPAVSQVNVFDARGMLLYSSRYSRPTFSIADRPYFKSLRDDPHLGLAFSDAQIARATGHWALMLDYPVRDAQGHLIGVVGCVINLDEYAQLLHNIQLGAGGVALIRRADSSRLVLRVPEVRSNYYNQTLPNTNPIQAGVKQGISSGTLAYKASTDGVERLATFYRLKDYPFYVQVSLAKSNYLAAWRMQVWIASLVFAAFFLLILLSIIRASRYARRQIALESAIADSEVRFHTLFETSNDAAMVFNRSGVIDCNQAALQLFGVSGKAEFRQLDLAHLSAPCQPDGAPSAQLLAERIAAAGQQGSHRFEWMLRRMDNGVEFPAEVVLSVSELHGAAVLLAMVRDFTEHKHYEERIYRLAFYDALTRLPNRRLLSERLQQALLQSQRRGQYGAVIYLDLDNFKPLNDLHGHAAGDLLLQEVALRIGALLRAEDTVARLGGDEFVIILVELDGPLARAKEHACQVAEKIRSALAQPYLLTVETADASSQKIVHQCSASLGLALFSPLDKNAEQIVHRADDAMYLAKSAGRNRIRLDGAQEAPLETT
jgi:diguanylate cyclase (GGDEF)-like protein/PAS domain S-box-containing protein